MGRRSIKVLPPGADELLSTEDEFTRFIQTRSSDRIVRATVETLAQRMLNGEPLCTSAEEHQHFETALRRTCILLVIEEVMTTIVGRALNMFELNKRGATPQARARLNDKLGELFSELATKSVSTEMAQRRMMPTA